MKVCIELTEAEVKGIKAYLSEVDGVKAGKVEIRQFVQGFIEAINSPQEAVSHYIREADIELKHTFNM